MMKMIKNKVVSTLNSLKKKKKIENLNHGPNRKINHTQVSIFKQ